MIGVYKGKRKDNGEWAYGAYIVMHHNDGRNHLHHFIIPDDSDLSFGVKVEDILVEVIPETIGPCTELQDKKGRWIFDGDIVKYDDYIFFVKYGKCGGVPNADNYGYMGFYLDGYDEHTKRAIRFGLRQDICYFTDLEVIGNIHDNPESREAGV